MRGIVRRFLDSPALWFIGLFFWIWLTARCWDRAVTERFAAPRIVTAVLATALTGFGILLFILNRGWRKDSQVAPGHCAHCDYDLTGNISGVCPECGSAISRSARSKLRQDALANGGDARTKTQEQGPEGSHTRRSAK